MAISSFIHSFEKTVIHTHIYTHTPKLIEATAVADTTTIDMKSLSKLLSLKLSSVQIVYRTQSMANLYRYLIIGNIE